MRRLLLILGLAACGPSTEPPDETPVTYYEDVKPIFDAKCAGCHHAGTIAPFTLTSYEDAIAYREAIGQAVADGTMPPWSAAKECRPYKDDRSLTDAQRRTVLAWVRQGGREGERPANVTPYAPAVSGLDRVDATVTTPVYEVDPPKAAGVDDHRCFLVDLPVDDDAYVTGVEVVPGNPLLVHHVSLQLAEGDAVAKFQALDDADPGPGWYCYGGSGARPTGNLGGWVPGWSASEAPDGFGRKITAGTKLVINMHYNTLFTAAGTDQTRVNLKLAGYRRPLFSTGILDPGWVLHDWFQIKAGDPDAVFTFEYDPTLFTLGRRFLIYNAYIHMHQLGKSGKLTLKHEDGSEECLLDVPAFDFQWQSEYWFTEPVQIVKGDKIYLECRFDNSAENQRIVDGVRQKPRDIGWGGDAPNEMCAGLFLSSF